MGKQQRQQQKNNKGPSQNMKKGQSVVPSFPPNLLVDKKKSKQKLNVSVLVPSAVFAAKNFMDPDECKSWVKFAEDAGFEDLCSPQTREYAQRECGRISKTDWCMADRLYQRMKSVVEEIASQVTISNRDESYAPITCNGNLRLYRYQKNMSFGRHYDGSEDITSRIEGAHTEITVLVYLSSCKGGATRFYLPTSSKRKSNGKKKTSNNDKDGIAFCPEVGAILMHIHGDRCLEHEADPVLDGIKYVLRTDIVYAPSK